MTQYGLKANRKYNNIWVFNRDYDPLKYTLLLNSHIDTIPYENNWTIDPFIPTIKNDKLYGLGSNDAGGALGSMLMTFLYFNNFKDFPINIILALTGEEEIAGEKGIRSIIDQFGRVNLAIVGEPTSMNLAIAEKGLIVLDCINRGHSEHAALGNDNSIYKTWNDIKWFKEYNFPKESSILGKIKMTVTQINGGHQYNIVPAKCTFVVDIRTNELYNHDEIIGIIRTNTNCDIKPRRMDLVSSCIRFDHDIVGICKDLGLEIYGSPTTSDQTQLKCNSVKIGPGDSKRSHTIDEYIKLSEMKRGIETYIKLINNLHLKQNLI